MTRLSSSALALALVVPAVWAAAQDRPARFSDAAAGEALPAGWRQLELKGARRPTQWRLVEDGGSVALLGSADGGASLVYSPVVPGPDEDPVLRWRWKTAGTVAGSDLARRRGDDAAARVYVAFMWDPRLEGPWQRMVGPWQRLKYRLARARLGEMPPFAAIVYLWAHDEPVGWTAPNPSFERAVQIVLRNRKDPTGVWLDETRDATGDFRDWFGFDPPPISHIAVMVDTDDTHSATESWFGDLVFAEQQRTPGGAGGSESD